MSKDRFKFDFTNSATRKAIFGPLVAATDKKDHPRIAKVIDDTSIPAEAHLHNYDDVARAIDTTIASEYAKEHAKAVYRILAEAEAQVHGCSVEDTHFHEVGLGMTCREVLGICTAFEIVDAQKIVATAVQTGSGTVECAHGTLDIPAPATAAILERYNIPVASEKSEGELCTPTSAALIAHFVEEFE